MITIKKMTVEEFIKKELEPRLGMGMPDGRQVTIHNRVYDIIPLLILNNRKMLARAIQLNADDADEEDALFILNNQEKLPIDFQFRSLALVFVRWSRPGWYGFGGLFWNGVWECQWYDT